MSAIDIFSKIIVPIISILTLIWAVASIFIVYGQNKKLAVFEKKNYVSKAVFDKLFALFQTVSDLMFELYNAFQKNLYPKLDCLNTATKEEKIIKMRTFQDETKALLNKFIKEIHTNRFLIEFDIFEALVDFEECAKNLYVRYEDRIHDEDACKEDRWLSREDKKQLEEQAIKLRDHYETIESLMEEYILYLQVD